MGAHLIDGEFQSDKYPTCPRGKVPLSVKDPTAQDLLWQYAQRRRSVDAEFADDLEAALRAAGYLPPLEIPVNTSKRALLPLSSGWTPAPELIEVGAGAVITATGLLFELLVPRLVVRGCEDWTITKIEIDGMTIPGTPRLAGEFRDDKAALADAIRSSIAITVVNTSDGPGQFRAALMGERGRDKREPR
jgi:hypothetical protein